MSKTIRISTVSLVLLFLSFSPALAQYVFDHQTVDVSNMGIRFSNIGTIGNPNVQSQPDQPSMQFPDGSGTEHMFESGIWLGAQYGGQTRVSTSAVPNPSGYTRIGEPGYEFTNDGTPVFERSSLPESNFFSTDAVSHQDFVAEFSDRRTVVNGTPISGHEDPLYADVVMESYNWNFGFSDGISIVKYEITNNSHEYSTGETWEEFYFGLYSNLVVRNVNTTQDTGGAFYNKAGAGYDDSLYVLYEFDANSDDNPRTDTYGGTMILGAEYRDVQNYHPRYADEVIDAGMEVPNVGPTFWKFFQGGGRFDHPSGTDDYYARLSEFGDGHQFDYYEYPDDVVEQLRTDGKDNDGNYLQTHRFGPFPEVEPGETITVYVAFLAALKPEQFQGLIPAETPDVDNLDTPEPIWDIWDEENEEWLQNPETHSRYHLMQAADWAIQLFEGQEDPDTGERERFLVPEPPAVPQMRVELDEGSATVYWDDRAEESVDPVSGEKDFEGYRLYRTKAGADLEGDISSGREKLRQWDKKGSNHGYNTGFEEIELDQPVTFEGDDTEYTYAFEIDGMLSGWQYQFAVTSFDRGEDGRESLESSLTANAISVFPGARPNENFESGDDENKVRVYPNPYRVDAAWDGGTEFTRKINFTNLPPNAEIRVYTLSGDEVARMEHNSESYQGDIRWYQDVGSSNRIFSGGEHSWDLLSQANQNLATGLYLFTVRDLDSGHVQTGKFAIIK